MGYIEVMLGVWGVWGGHTHGVSVSLYQSSKRTRFDVICVEYTVHGSRDILIFSSRLALVHVVTEKCVVAVQRDTH